MELFVKAGLEMAKFFWGSILTSCWATRKLLELV